MPWSLRVVVVLLALSASASLAMDLVSQSDEHVVATEGQELRLFCESAEPYTFCSWDVPGGVRCAITADGLDDTCFGNSRVIWEQDGNRCGILVEEASRAQGGNSIA